MTDFGPVTFSTLGSRQRQATSNSFPRKLQGLVHAFARNQHWLESAHTHTERHIHKSNFRLSVACNRDLKQGPSEQSRSIWGIAIKALLFLHASYYTQRSRPSIPIYNDPFASFDSFLYSHHWSKMLFMTLLFAVLQFLKEFNSSLWQSCLV